MIMMADVWYSVKNFLLHAAKGISRTAKSVVRAVRFKFDQVSTSKKRRVLIRSLGEKVFELSSTGVELPSEAADIVNQINQLNEHAVTTKDAYVAEKAVVAEQAAADKAAWAEEKAAHAEAKAIRKAEMEARKQVIGGKSCRCSGEYT